jgi:hypothetical protein
MNTMVIKRYRIGAVGDGQEHDHRQRRQRDERRHRQVLRHQDAPQPLAVGQLSAHPLRFETQRVGAHHTADHRGEQIQRQPAHVVVFRPTAEVIERRQRQADAQGDEQARQDRARSIRPDVAHFHPQPAAQISDRRTRSRQ